jgi:sigma-E factor negative regulatory protein RseC
MLETGIIIKIDGKKATVKINKAQACSHCKSKCMESDGFMITEAINSVGANIGDVVKLEINSKTALRAILIVFGLPLVIMLAGVFIAIIITNNQAYIIAVGVIMLLLAIIPLKAYDNHLRKKETCGITIIEVLS